ncbi:MAG: flagellar basal body-associated FliL family protein [Sphingomonas sp.]|uniref:flagellar basal body-associated FliL family protein n=1 Tax=Sphingomonas sp. TaxID=28214 RepID=UPI001AC44FB9|nr:flagellar basal body-associated FliL family protein [Sphingomonas sp.]MBN8816418.1 flagellar basal body-associated FliL family protein [Sphingomonas sp.]
MSDETEAATDAAPKKKKGKGKLIMTLGAVTVLGGGAGGAYALGYLGGGSHAKTPAEEAGYKLVPKSEQKRGGGGEGGKEGEGGGAGKAPPPGVGGDKYASNYYAMDKEFTSNLQDSVHYVQVGIALSTPYEETVIENVKTNEIAVRSAILMALGDATEDEVFTSQGKDKLAKRLTAAINATLKQKEGFGGISNVYFTSFVVQ